MRNTPAEMNGVEPEFFSDGRVRAEPRFKVMIGGLPVVPFGGGGINGASGGAEVIDVERLQDEGDVTFGFFKIVENKISIFGEIEGSVEGEGFGDFGTIEFIDG